MRVFVRFFIASLLLTLTWGATLGMINLARLTAGWGFGVLPRPSVWAHGYVQVFGFMALFIMGVAYHVLPRFVGGTLQSATLVPWSFWLQLGGVVAIACGFFHDGALTRPLWIAGSASVLVASGIFCWIVLRTMRSGQLFGETAVLYRGPRSATIQAKTDVITLRVPGPAFLDLLHASPEPPFHQRRTITASP